MGGGNGMRADYPPRIGCFGAWNGEMEGSGSASTAACPFFAVQARLPAACLRTRPRWQTRWGGGQGRVPGGPLSSWHRGRDKAQGTGPEHGAPPPTVAE